MNLILLTGDSESGKDFVADYLVRWFGCNKVSLATPIKELVAAKHNITLAELEVLKNNPNSTIRADLQEVGQGALASDPDTWVRVAWDKITAPLLHFYPNMPVRQSANLIAESAVVSDVRQVAELIYFAREFGWDNIRLVAIERQLDKSKNKYKHPVEQSIATVKLFAGYVYHNNVLLPNGYVGRFAPLDALGYLITSPVAKSPLNIIWASAFQAKSQIISY